MKDYKFHYEIDAQRYGRFWLDLDMLMRFKCDHCAPIHERHWSDALIKQIKQSWTGKQIKHITKELNEYCERMGFNNEE